MVDKRYFSQQILPEIGVLGQLKLSTSKILVVGCGGLAAAVLPYLAAAGVGRITLMDEDQVSVSNLNRQVLFKETDIGLNKTIVLQRQLRQQNPEINVVALPKKFDLENGVVLTQSHDLVIDCSDHYLSKIMINYCCVQSNTPLVYASVLAWDGQVALLPMRQVGDPCYKCWQKLAPQEINNCTHNGVLGASVSIVGSHQATLALQYLLGCLHSANVLFVFDLWSLKQKQFKLHQRKDCKLHLNKSHDKLQYIDWSALGQLGHYILLDVRTINEWEMGHLPGAKHVSLGQLLQSEQYNKATDNLVIYCNQERLSTCVVENLQNLGYNAFVLKGGYCAYQDLKIEEFSI